MVLPSNSMVVPVRSIFTEIFINKHMRYKLLKLENIITTPLFYDYYVMDAAGVNLKDALSKINNPIRVIGVEHRSDNRHNIVLEGGHRKNNVDLARLLVAKP